MSGIDEFRKDIESEPDPVFRKGMHEALDKIEKMSVEERRACTLPLTLPSVPKFKWETHEFEDLAKKSGLVVPKKKKLKHMRR